MALLKTISNTLVYQNILRRVFCDVSTKPSEFETVFTFPTIKYISIINRLKVYQLAGTAVAIPSSGILEMASLIPDYSFLTTSYIGLTAAAVLSLATLPFRDVIGFLYISKDNKFIKISSVDFWGKRVDKVVSTDDWVPILEMQPKKMDTICLTPELTDGTKYKLFIKFGKVLNAKKIGQVLE